MKKSRLSYDEWKCIEKKQIHGKRARINGFEGYIGLLNIEKVTVPQIWKFNLSGYNSPQLCCVTNFFK